MSRKHDIISYLLCNDISDADRLQIAYEVEHRFPCEKHYKIVPKIIEVLEDDRDVPSIEYFVDNYDYTYFTDTVDNVPTTGDAYDLVEQDYKALIKNEFMRNMQSYMEKPDEEIDVEEMMVNFRKEIDKFDDKLDIRGLKSLEEYYEEREETKVGLHSYIDPIDDCIRQFETGTLSTLGGKAGQFKTTIALWMMYKNILDGKNVVFFSMEMSRELILYLIASRHSYHEKWHGTLDPIPSEKIRDGELDAVDKEMLINKVWDDLKTNDDYGDFEILEAKDFNGFTTTSMRSRLARLDFDVDGMVVDYIQDFKYEDHPFKNIQSDPINYYVRAFSRLTEDVDGSGKEAHVMLLSQVNKQGYRNACENQGMYGKGALAEANMLERESTQIWFTFAPKELKDIGQAKVCVAKNRYGKEHSEAHEINLEAGVLYASGTDDEKMDAQDTDLSDMF